MRERDERSLLQVLLGRLLHGCSGARRRAGPPARLVFARFRRPERSVSQRERRYDVEREYALASAEHLGFDW